MLEKENEFDLDSKNESASNLATDTAAIQENPISFKLPSVENTSQPKIEELQAEKNDAD